MSTGSPFACCTSPVELDRLLCRLSAHDSYGASAAVEPCREDSDAADAAP